MNKTITVVLVVSIILTSFFGIGALTDGFRFEPDNDNHGSENIFWCIPTLVFFIIVVACALNLKKTN